MEREGIEYVVAAYAVSAATLAIWFWLIVRKLRRFSPSRTGVDG